MHDHCTLWIMQRRRGRIDMLRTRHCTDARMPRRTSTILALLVLGLSAQAQYGFGAIVAPSDPEFFFSPSNWARTAAGAASVNPGAYFKISYTNASDGGTPPVLLLRPNNASTVGTHYMNILYSIDDWDWVELAVLSNTTRLELVPNNGASVGVNLQHNLTVLVYNSWQSWNRWSAPTEAHGAAFVVRGLDLGSATPLARTDLAPKRCIFYGDSITEGVASQCTPAPGCTVGGDLCSNSATKTWVRAVAAAMDCEYSQIGFGGLGWSVGGGGGVVPVYTPGKPTESSWNQIYAGVPRTFTGHDAPDYVFILHGTNDGLRQKAASVQPVIASVHGCLHAMRSAIGAAPHIFLIVPFGGFGSVQDPIGALKAGFSLYQKDSPTDLRTHYMDLGATAMKGATGFGVRAVETCGGIHPRGGTMYSARHGELGAMIAAHAAVRIPGFAGDV